MGNGKNYIKTGTEWIKLGEALKDTRKRLGYSAKDVEEITGIGQTTLTGYECYGNISSQKLSYLGNIYGKLFKRPDEDVTYISDFRVAHKIYSKLIREGKEPFVDIVTNGLEYRIRIRYKKDEESQE